MIQEFNYPDEIAESLEQETELLIALYNDNSFDADDLNVEFDSDEEITNFIEETNSNIELEDTSNNQVENETIFAFKELFKNYPWISGVATGNLFNFLGTGLKDSRMLLIEQGIQLPDFF